MVLSACTPVQATRGNYIAPDEISVVKPGATQAEVLQALGTPTAKAVFDDNVWYYIGEETAQTAFYRPKIESKAVYELHFDEAGLLSDVRKHDEPGQDVALSSRVTPAHGKTLTIMQQMLGNVGRFNKSSGSGAPQVPGT